MHKFLAALVAALALAVAVPSVAAADPILGDGCLTVHNDRGVVVDGTSAIDGYGCDAGTYVEITTWWADTRDELGCNAYGDEPHGVCI